MSDAMPPSGRADSQERRHAVVLSGGGARGAYEVGVLKALFAGASPATGGRPLTARIFTGTSVGAYNAAFLAQAETAGAGTAARLEELWRRRIAETLATCGNGVYRLRADPCHWLDPGCLRQPLALLGEAGCDALFWSGYALAYGAQLFTSDEPPGLRALETINLAALFSRQPLQELVADTIDLGRLRASGSALAVVGFDWGNRPGEVFRKAEITERLGTAAILASAAIPGVFAPVELDGTAYVDGGLLMNTPLKPAIADGAEVLHVIFVDPLVTALPFPPLPNTLDTLSRLYTILLAAQINGDVRLAATVNEELAVLGRGPRSAHPVARARRQVEPGRGRGEGPPYRPLTIHRYRPQTDLGGIQGLLDFRLPYIDTLIHRGYEDAVHHDCRACACIVPAGT